MRDIFTGRHRVGFKGVRVRNKLGGFKVVYMDVPDPKVKGYWLQEHSGECFLTPD